MPLTSPNPMISHHLVTSCQLHPHHALLAFHVQGFSKQENVVRWPTIDYSIFKRFQCDDLGEAKAVSITEVDKRVRSQRHRALYDATVAEWEELVQSPVPTPPTHAPTPIPPLPLITSDLPLISH